MSNAEFIAGFYGKLPSHGDFVSRRLPRTFIEAWDQWLQGCIASSNEQLGNDWLDTFLFSPLWRFGLSSGICGDDAWAGVLMPSVDKVGRYFPLTVASKVNANQLKQLFLPDCGWFEAISQLALSSLEYEFDLQEFDKQLQELCLNDFLNDQSTEVCINKLNPASAKSAFRFEMETVRETEQAFVQLGEKLKERYLNRCSYWCATDSESSGASLLICEGLPPIDAYVGFLTGNWPQVGWQFSSCQLAKHTDSATVDQNLQVFEVTKLDIMPDQDKTINASMMNTKTVIEQKCEMDVRPNAHSKYQSFGMSVVGLRRKLNEDAILQRGEAGLWAVADGMGGHSAGDVASRLLVDTLAKIPPVDDLEFFSEQVASNLHVVNRKLLQLAKSRGSGHIIGSTIVLLLISGQQFEYLWAGDSRLYLYRQGKLEQLTLDHSLYNESISQGLSPQDGSLEQGRGNIITRAVGADSQLQLDCGQGEIEQGDLFILSSDGLDKELSHADIAQLCGNGTVEEITRNLIKEAESRGGRDNISVIVIKA